ncbi:MAG: YvcK family protein [Armatimonadota bacterium]|nr:YvcK family protein [Armatimonadota bacterium]
MKRIRSALKWLYPGMKVKRWLLLIPIGVFAILTGVVFLANINVLDYLERAAKFAYERFGIQLNQPATLIPISLALIAFGLILIFVAIKQVIDSITSVISPQNKGKLADVIYQKRYLSQGHNIVVIGGGTGLSTLLRGLKEYTSNIVAIVTVTDDGGSSGALRRELGIAPPGDIRNCLVALADAEPLMTELFQYRFGAGGKGLEGHSFGNLLIAAMTNITGDFEQAVKETSRVLAIRGRVLPSTNSTVTLQAEMEDGTLVEGETNIAEAPQAIKTIHLHPSNVTPVEESLLAISLADVIIIGPGSVYTSVVPNLLVPGIAEAVNNADAMKIYVCNVMTQPGETDNYTASDHIRAVTRHAEGRLFNYVMVNRQAPSVDMIARYLKIGAEPVAPDVDKIRELGFRPVVGDFMNQTTVVRHDSQKLAEAIMRLIY